MTKCKRRLLPAEPYEIDALESWFSDLSAEGLHLQKANALFATFTEGEKKRLLFRMEPKQAGALSTLDKIKAEERHAQHKEKGWSFKPIDVICFTHYHGDHISGLPGLLLTMGNADRREPLTLIGPKGLERVVSCLRVIAPELPFPIIYQEIQGAEQAFRVNHNVLCYGYTIEIDRAGKFDVERARANEIPQKYWSCLQNGETVESEMGILTPDMVLGPQRKGIKLTYTTDTRPTDSIRENAKDSDLFI